MKGPVAIAMLAMIVMALALVHPSEAISCGALTGMISPCLGYLRSGGSPTKGCCDGARSVQGATRSHTDRRFAYKCAKAVAKDLASSLPGKCGIAPPFRSDPTSTATRE
ncbi:putative plant non-specific lipid-transfer protein/Par allergen [Helianthus annuus]|nr:putative plant non-specific lipid-transfer protein/Par allergen [Helianthus annuus]